MRNAALYIEADPFTFNDIDIVKKCIKAFGFASIFLDRKNRDAQHQQYTLSYADRADIIKHDLKLLKIDSYRIVPVDTTLQQTMQQEDIDVLVLNFDSQARMDFRMMKIFQEVNPDIPIMLLRGKDYIERKFIQTLIDSDSTMLIYKKYCSDYSFCRLKLKEMKKIGLTGNRHEKIQIAENAFKEHGYEVVDLDDFVDKLDKKTREDEKAMYQAVNAYMANKIVGHFSDKIVVAGMKIYEYAMEKMFQKIVCMDDKLVDLEGDLMPIQEKASYANYVVDSLDDSAIPSKIADLASQKLKRL